MQNPYWSREELILAFNLYSKIPYGKFSEENPKIVSLSELINRPPSAVVHKLGILASSDPSLNIKAENPGPNKASSDKLIFEEFHSQREDMVFESELILAKYEKQTIEKKFQNKLQGIYKLTGEERKSYIRTRVTQNFFKEMIQANYQGKCAITGIDIPELVTATHIIPWAQNKKERLNPNNGICLSFLYDQAFCKNLISLDEDYRLILSPYLKEYYTKSYFQTHFGQMEGQSILLPIRGIPKQEFLQWHRERLKE